jgi:hypothetical protein
MFANVSRAPSEIVCPVCNRMLWWRSRTGRRVCMVCHPDPLDALGTPLPARGQSRWLLEQAVMTVTVYPLSQ